MHDSSVYKPDPLVDPLVQSLANWYQISPPAPIPGPDNTPDKAWLEKNLVAVIVVGVVGFMVLAAILYCLCCKSNAKGYQNALYDEDSSMKARI